MNDTEPQACPRIYTRCPACHNDTLTINKGHLLCTWHECKDPTLLDRTSELVRAGDRAHKAGGEPEELKALASATCCAAPPELVEALKEINRHIELLEIDGRLGMSGSIVAARKQQELLVAALCVAQHNR